MAKKRKASRQAEAPSGPKEYDAKDSRLDPINTFEDIADEQEEYFLDKDKIALDSERGTKRQRQQQVEEEFIDLSDDEVFRRDSDDSANESGEDDGERRKQKKKDKKAKAKKVKAERAAKLAEDDEDDEADTKAAGGGDDSGWWGSSKEHYYDGEVIETEDGAMEEEAEARRLQKKQLSRMKASDFFDADDWTTDANASAPADQDAAAKSASTKGASASGPAGAVTMTIMSKSEIDTMTGEEKYKLLQEHYPELDHLCDEFTELEPLMTKYKEMAVGKAPETLEVIQFRSISCYVATIALYFSILMSPSRDDPNGPRYVMDPEELHNHEVMEYLVVARNNWEWVKRVQTRRAAKASKEQKQAAAAAKESTLTSAKERLQLLDTIPEMIAGSKTAQGKKKVKAAKKEKKSKKASAVSQAVEDSLADLANLLPKKGKKVKKTKASKKSAASDDEGHSDLGEEETIDARTADEKLKRKKSLGFYTSQIMQKSSMRSGATGQAGGDVDIPYRERLRDRQERLHTAAVRRGLNEAPNELGGSDDDDNDNDADEHSNERDANLSYYDSIVNAHKEKMAAKEARKAETEAMKLNRVTPGEWADKDGRRQLTWEIEKNKGLSHRTLKEKKNNPRVKKRIKFEKKKKQLASMRATYKPMNPSDYQGERTGIKTGLIRSIKLE
ncbi:sas10 utp3 family protein [Ophiostoma piceae UAMH 11346]|uniref:Sas10 utp3 family protein n=1 Tax=Ophiostoma piceae (strain UAMH 11346) TaxID=1262450 RepID=S3BZV9_OPHP1|nr:sas10 utp3 family protein [Ophiostoma piceae UAMH 11346]